MWPDASRGGCSPGGRAAGRCVYVRCLRRSRPRHGRNSTPTVALAVLTGERLSTTSNMSAGGSVKRGGGSSPRESRVRKEPRSGEAWLFRLASRHRGESPREDLVRGRSGLALSARGEPAKKPQSDCRRTSVRRSLLKVALRIRGRLCSWSQPVGSFADRLKPLLVTHDVILRYGDYHRINGGEGHVKLGTLPNEVWWRVNPLRVTNRQASCSAPHGRGRHGLIERGGEHSTRTCRSRSAAREGRGAWVAPTHGPARQTCTRRRVR